MLGWDQPSWMWKETVGSPDGARGKWHFLGPGGWLELALRTVGDGTQAEVTWGESTKLRQHTDSTQRVPERREACISSREWSKMRRVRWGGLGPAGAGNLGADAERVTVIGREVPSSTTAS